MPAPPPTGTGTGTGTGTEPRVEPVPHGWPSDDPTVRDEEGVLGRRPRRPPPEPASGDDREDGPAVAVVTEGRDHAGQRQAGGPDDLLGGRRRAGPAGRRGRTAAATRTPTRTPAQSITMTTSTSSTTSPPASNRPGACWWSW